MSDTQRCDGFYWLEKGGRVIPARWTQQDEWWDTIHFHGHATAIAGLGYECLAPVTPPATVAALVEALEHIAGPDAPFDANPEAFGMHAARRMREQAAAALALYRGDVA